MACGTRKLFVLLCLGLVLMGLAQAGLPRRNHDDLDDDEDYIEE